MIQFVDIDKAEEEVRLLHPGTIFFDDVGAWHASRPGTGYSLSGYGPISALEPGFWMSNLPFEKVKGIISGQKTWTMRADAWMRMRTDMIFGSWGLSDLPLDKSVSLVSHINARVFRLLQEVLERDGEVHKYEVKPQVDQICSSSSLSIGINSLLAPRLLLTRPAESMAQKVLDEAMTVGMLFPRPRFDPENMLSLSFTFGRISYALRVCKDNVPAARAWQTATRPDALSSEAFVAELSARKLPTVLRGSYTSTPLQTNEYFDVFAKGDPSKLSRRTRFTLEEVEAVGSRMQGDFNAVYVGSAWTRSSIHGVLEELVDVCGGPVAAGVSWSAGLLADNILNAAFRKSQALPSAANGESVWLAARDRIAMLPAISALIDAGAAIDRAAGGVIQVKVSQEPELLMSVLQVAWEEGLSLSLEDAQNIAKMGIHVPADRETYGGNDVDYILAALAHQGKRNAMWKLDGVVDKPQREREKMIKNMLS